ncbi:hypothetical protein [Dactylosporangium sp. CA-139066]|uniref:hypothetical protein n=1 Tax=Dactylosporangium sp. CA-139066 TaxID=3239930 RepID=UPI003D93D07F
MQLSVAARRVVGFAVAYAVVELAVAALLAATGNVPSSLQARAVVVTLLVIGLVGFAVVLGLLISGISWLVAAAREAREQGRPTNRLIGFYVFGAFVLLFVLGFFDLPGGVYAAIAVRMLGVAALIAGVRHSTAVLRQGAGVKRPYSEEPPMVARPTAEDWDASVWDPDVLKDIDRRRHKEGR